MVGDRGMITSARIDALRELDGATRGSPRCAPPPSASSWPTTGPCRCRLFDEQTSPRSPATTSPASASSPAATPPSPANAPASARTCSPPPRSPSPRSPPASPPGGSPAPPRSARRSATSSASTRWPNTSTSPSPTPASTVDRNQAQIDAETPLDGIYVIRTTVPAADLDTADRHRLQKPHARRTRLPLPQNRRPGPAPRPPPPRRSRPRPRADLHPRRLPHLAPAPRPRAADLHRRGPTRPASPVAPARRSAPAEAKASRQHHGNGHPYLSYQGLLDHLATLTRNELRFPAPPPQSPPHRAHQPPA